MPALPDRRSSAACVRRGVPKRTLGPFGDGPGDFVLGARVADQRDDLVRADTRANGSAPPALRQASHQRFQHLVADVPAERFVDVLEAIDVEDDERERRLAARSGFKGPAPRRCRSSVQFARPVSDRSTRSSRARSDFTMWSSANETCSASSVRSCVSPSVKNPGSEA